MQVQEAVRELPWCQGMGCLPIHAQDIPVFPVSSDGGKPRLRAQAITTREWIWRRLQGRQSMRRQPERSRRQDTAAVREIGS